MNESKELDLTVGTLTALPRTFTHDGHSFEIKHDRVIRDGRETCVLISVNYGGGWSTWCDKLTPFEPAAVLAVLLDRKDALLTPDSKAFGEQPSDAFRQILGVGPGEYIFMGGVRDLVIEYLPIGAAFTIEEYDGNESIRTLADMGYTA